MKRMKIAFKLILMLILAGCGSNPLDQSLSLPLAPGTGLGPSDSISVTIVASDSLLVDFMYVDKYSRLSYRDTKTYYLGSWNDFDSTRNPISVTEKIKISSWSDSLQDTVYPWIVAKSFSNEGLKIHCLTWDSVTCKRIPLIQDTVWYPEGKPII